MDTITHALVGAVTARAAAPGASSDKHLPIKIRVIVGGLAAAFPDIDFITLWINPLAYIADWHRAETHSFVMLPLWAMLLGVLFAWIAKRRHHWQEFAIICGLAIFSHIVTDLITSWGTMIFAPISGYRANLGLTFIIDPLFTLIILTGLVVALVRHSRRIARLGLVVLAVYVGAQSVLKFQATAIGEAYAAKRLWSDAQVHTLPQPFSPFHWKIVVNNGRHYHVSYVDLIAGDDKPVPDKTRTSLLAVINYYRPHSQLQWQSYKTADSDRLALEVWQRPEMAPYRRFARLPVLLRVDRTGTSHCVWFVDLRFVIPTRISPFRYGMCKQGREGEWQLYQLQQFSEDIKLRVSSVGPK
ncbi:MAG: metal-dependent hydrolase [Acidiferrobacterales bacterium]